MKNSTAVFGCVWLFATAGAGLAQEATSRRVTTPGAAGSQVLINQIETSRFPEVEIFATVLKDGAPVTGLTAADFRVREDEVDQEPITVAPKLTPLSVVLTLDTSGSMKKRLAQAQAAAKSFLASLQPADRVQVIRFSRDVKTLYPLGASRADAGAAIDSTVPRGDTALWDALYASLEAVREVPGRKAIALLSDGVDDDGTGQPLSKRTARDVLALARQANVPIYAIGIGTELDEEALRNVATESGALYLAATEPAELKRLYDNIGQQLAGQYSIHYSSDLPADGSEHRVQLKAGSVTGSKAYTPQGKLAAAVPAPKPPAPAPSAPARAQAGPADTVISSKAPSTKLTAPVPLELGEVVKGRLDAFDKSQKRHYWAVDLPAGQYKFVLELKRADDASGNIGGALQLITPDDAEGKSLGSMNESDVRRRQIFRLDSKEPVKGVLSYENSFTMSDYLLAVFREDDALEGIFFTKAPALTPLTRGKPTTTPMLDGERPNSRDAYYSVQLPAGDYKVSVEFRRADGESGNVGGQVTTVGPEGDDRDVRVVFVNETGMTGKGDAKLSLADDTNVTIRVQASFTKETAVLRVDDWAD